MEANEVMKIILILYQLQNMPDISNYMEAFTLSHYTFTMDALKPTPI
jgi:hypothetical protein